MLLNPALGSAMVPSQSPLIAFSPESPMSMEEERLKIADEPPPEDNIRPTTAPTDFSRSQSQLLGFNVSDRLKESITKARLQTSSRETTPGSAGTVWKKIQPSDVNSHKIRAKESEYLNDFVEASPTMDVSPRKVLNVVDNGGVQQRRIRSFSCSSDENEPETTPGSNISSQQQQPLSAASGSDHSKNNSYYIHDQRYTNRLWNQLPSPPPIGAFSSINSAARKTPTTLNMHISQEDLNIVSNVNIRRDSDGNSFLLNTFGKIEETPTQASTPSFGRVQPQQQQQQPPMSPHILMSLGHNNNGLASPLFPQIQQQQPPNNSSGSSPRALNILPIRREDFDISPIPRDRESKISGGSGGSSSRLPTYAALQGANAFHNSDKYADIDYLGVGGSPGPLTAGFDGNDEEALVDAVAKGDVFTAQAVATSLARRRKRLCVYVQPKRSGKELWDLVREKFRSGKIVFVKGSLWRRGMLLDAIYAMTAKHRRRIRGSILDPLGFDSTQDNNQIYRTTATTKGTISLFFLRLLLTIIVSLSMVAISLLCYVLTENMTFAKVRFINLLFEKGSKSGAFFLYFFINVILAGVSSSLLSLFCPEAKGSGHSMAFRFLNGSNMSSCWKPAVLMIKVPALVTSVASGLPFSIETPFIHIGALIASSVMQTTQEISKYLPPSFKTILRTISTNQNELRSLMSCGVASGLAVGFNAPISAALISIEACSSFITVQLSFRILIAASISSILINSGRNGFFYGFGSLFLTNDHSYNVLFGGGEIVSWTIMALVLGCFAAFTTHINLIINKHLFLRYHLSRKFQISFAIVSVAIISIIKVGLAAYPSCRLRSDLSQMCIPPPNSMHFVNTLICPTYTCQNADLISEMATLILQPPQKAAVTLLSASYPDNYQELSPAVLVVYGMFYMTMIAIMYGLLVPGGIAVPCIIIGASFGRTVGIWMVNWYGEDYVVSSNLYALMGAAAFIGGMSKLAVPLVLMLVEVTGSTPFLLPMLLMVLLSKFVARCLTANVIHMHTDVEDYKVYPDVCPTVMFSMNDVMRPIGCSFSAIKTEEDLLALSAVAEDIDEFRVAVKKDGTFSGIITKTSLLKLMWIIHNQIRSIPPPESISGTYILPINKFNHDAIEYSNSNFPPKLPLGWMRPGIVVPIDGYVETSIHQVRSDFPVTKVYDMFRRLSINVIVVINERGKAIGAISRNDFLEKLGVR